MPVINEHFKQRLVCDFGCFSSYACSRMMNDDAQESQ